MDWEPGDTSPSEEAIDQVQTHLLRLPTESDASGAAPLATPTFSHANTDDPRDVRSANDTPDLANAVTVVAPVVRRSAASGDEQPGRRAAPTTRRLTPTKQRGWGYRAAIAAILLVCFLIGYGGVSAAMALTDALAAARDAKVQAAAIQGLIRGGQLTDVATLTALQSRLSALDTDLKRISADEPAQPPLYTIISGTSAAHALNMAHDLTQAGLYGVSAGLLIAPHLKSLMSSIAGAKDSAHSATSTDGGPLTLDDITQAQADVTTAGQYLVQALAERTHVHDSDLQAFGLGSFVHTLHELDALSPDLPRYIAFGKEALDALPSLLGFGQPANLLLLNLDSDELRPTGGFQGVYDVVTFKNAQLSSGVHLQNIYLLDCRGGFPPNCPVWSLPSSYSWFAFPDGLRNANLDPNYPTSARLDERMLTVEGGPTVAGVVSITPSIIHQALALTGPISVPGYPEKVTSENITELIHYYHSILGAANTSTTKAFDAAAGSALLAAFAKLAPAAQMQFIHDLIGDLRSGELQVYFNDPRLESVLSAFQVAGELQSPIGDTFEVVNTNEGANYANADVTLTESDQVVITAQGSALHTLTLTYQLPVKQHLYTSSLVGVYRDVVQVLAPARAHFTSMRGCTGVGVTEPGWADSACAMSLVRGGSATVVFTWETPHATISAPGGAHYHLLVQRQSGTHDTLVVTIAPPANAQLAQPLMSGLTVNAQHQVKYMAVMTSDQAISLAWQTL